MKLFAFFLWFIVAVLVGLTMMLLDGFNLEATELGVSVWEYMGWHQRIMLAIPLTLVGVLLCVLQALRGASAGARTRADLRRVTRQCQKLEKKVERAASRR